MSTTTLNSTNASSDKLRYLVFICFASALGGLLFGIDMLVVGGTISHVEAQFGLTAGQVGWFVSSALAGCFLGAMSSGVIADKIGRKKPLIIAAVLAIISVIGCAFADTYFVLTLARFIGGFGIGIATMVSPLFISEMSPAKHRGKLTTLFQLAITIGIVVAIGCNAFIVNSAEHAESTGSLFDSMFVDEVWRGMFTVELLPAVLFLIISSIFPESPRWLIKEGRDEEAKQVLLRVLDEEEANQSIVDCKAVMEIESKGTYRELFTNAGKKKALFVALFLAIVSEWSGITAVFYYGSTILEDAMGQGAALGGFTLIAIINVIFTVGSIFFIDKLGRKKLLMIGTIGCVAALVLIGLFIDDPNASGALLIALFGFFVAAFATAIGGIKFTVGAEIFPTAVRGRAMAISTAAVWVQGTIINAFVPVFMEQFSVSSLFFMFALILSSQIWFILKVMPETANRTLEEIERELMA
ncbi:sugar porter family MFS transporter [Vibrio mediterranei]